MSNGARIYGGRKMKEIKKGERMLITHLERDAKENTNVSLGIQIGPNYKVQYKFNNLDDAIDWGNSFIKLLIRAKNDEI